MKKQIVRILVVIGCFVLGAAGCKCPCSNPAAMNSTIGPDGQKLETSVDVCYSASAARGSTCQVR